MSLSVSSATNLPLSLSLSLSGEKKRELYVPPAPPEEEDKIFATMAAGINFDKYDEIAAEVTGSDPPPAITRSPTIS